MVLFCLPHIFYGQEKYTLKGQLPDHTFDGEYIKLYRDAIYYENYEKLIDSVLVKNGTIVYQGVITESPFYAYLQGKSRETGRWITVHFILEPGKIEFNLTDYPDFYTLCGTPIMTITIS